MIIVSSPLPQGAVAPAQQSAPRPAPSSWAARPIELIAAPTESQLPRPRPHAVYDIMGSGAALLLDRGGQGGARW